MPLEAYLCSRRQPKENNELIVNTPQQTFRAALGQFFVKETSTENLAAARSLIERSETAGADLLVLPECIIARKQGMPEWGQKQAEPLDGPFVSGLREATRGRRVTVVCTVQAKIANESRYANDLLVIQNGELRLTYQKIHLYDAFRGKESRYAAPGDVLPPVLQIGPFKVGFLTCYDVRFPEMTRALACAGATLLVVSAAWVKGALKEMQWDICLRARALENTCYLIGVSECGPATVGSSKVVDPMGVVVAQCGIDEQLLMVDLDPCKVEASRRVLPVLENNRFTPPELQKLPQQ